MKKIILFGATGLIGNELLKLLLSNTGYQVTAFRRHPIVADRQPTTFVNEVIQFENLEEQSSRISGDVVICCLGTTIKKAKTKENFRKVDHDLVLKVASIAAANGVKSFMVISSIGADPTSRNFYLKTKGEMERDIQALAFERIWILRPSMLTGNRKEFRLGEKTGIALAKVMNPLLIGPLKKYRPIAAETVAKAMLALLNTEHDQKIYSSVALQQLGA